ncbi:MAG: hypothetical protein JNM82_13005, partial [Rhodocyclaceae bacterium]|nr:hypothetical protein [Rhodocyclaceae bacterium]
MGAISGFFCRRGDRADSEVLRRMSGTLAHRGPAGESVHVAGPLALAHRRDRLGDPISATAQGSRLLAGRYRAVCSGRVFNWRDIARDLAARNGQPPAADCLEAIVLAYHEGGTAAF